MVVEQEGITALIVPPELVQPGIGVDFANAQAMPLPEPSHYIAPEVQQEMINALIGLAAQGPEPSGFRPGQTGTGERHERQLVAPSALAPAVDEVTPEEFGITDHPFSTARSDLFLGETNTFYPYRASGKLFFNVGSSTAVCSASLINRGVVVTAAHCVANFGQRQFYSNWQFVPGYRNGVAPFGVWTVRVPAILTSYFDGTDSCANAGIICQNDVAVLLLNASDTGAYPGTATGWYGIGWNGFGFTDGGLSHITQIGYPVCLDNGQLMERNDSHGFISPSNADNTLIGSLMCGGSSGGPWLVNFGMRPTLTATTPGSFPDPNVVVGVTSWGFTSTAFKRQGASPFTSGNVLSLAIDVCNIAPPACF
jgi:V8-like Glu-specific endopeptidase